MNLRKGCDRVVILLLIAYTIFVSVRTVEFVSWDDLLKIFIYILCSISAFYVWKIFSFLILWVIDGFREKNMSKDLLDKKFDMLFKILEELPKRICDEFESREERREI